MNTNKNEYLDIKGLKIVLSKEEILNDINFSVKEGELVSIVGSSGSGKSTLLNSVAGLIKKASGEIKINGLSSNKNIGYVFQDFNLYENISVYRNIFLSIKNSYFWKINRKIEFLEAFDPDNVYNSQKIIHKYRNDTNKEIFLNDKNQFLFYLAIKKHFLVIFKNLIKLKKFKMAFKFLRDSSIKKMAKKDIVEISTNLKIDNILNKKSSAISGGQQQRVSLAKALAKKSDLILLDEPFAAFDAKIKEQTRDWLRTINIKYKTTMLFVTHDQNDAMLISDKIIFLDKKTISQFDTPSEVFENPKNLAVAKFIGYPEIVFLKSENEVDYYIRPNKIKIVANNESENYIKSIKTNGNLDILKIWSNDFQKYLEIITEVANYKVNERIDLHIKVEDILKFDKEGIRIYEDKKQL